MKISFFVIAFLMTIETGYIVSQEKMIDVLRNEVASGSTQENITKETHPALYSMIQRIATAASVPMPQYIRFFTAQQTETHYNKYTHTGTMYTAFKNFESYVNIMGDLYICHEVFVNSSYDEIEGIIALALAEKANNKPLKLIATGASTLATVLTSSYYLNKKYNLNLGELFFPDHFSYYVESSRTKIKIFSAQDKEDRILAFTVLFMILPTLITTRLAANYLRKKTDLEAAKLTTANHISEAILRIEKVKEKFTQENVISRIMSALKLKTAWNTLSYPFRSFTPEERVSYLGQTLVTK
ncbi:MAG TPA: hypothetical protein ENI08_02425 [Candidatus Dependentiae bacterium]|nr:hypothetical protein [Candidatus Dependentiae bacterium]